LGDFVSKFKAERIDGFALQRLKDEDFRELGKKKQTNMNKIKQTKNKNKTQVFQWDQGKELWQL